MSSKPKVNYFNVKGRGEIIRLTLAAAGVDFEDRRIEQSEWPEIKKTAPTGVAPWVETPEGAMVQGPAIARYFAKKHGLMGKSDWEYYLVERAIAQADDAFTELIKAFHAPQEKKEEMSKDFQANKGLSLLTNLEKFLQDGGSSGLFVSSGLTLADLLVLHLVDIISTLMPDFAAKFPKLRVHTEKVKAVSPNVAKWLETRPKTAH